MKDSWCTERSRVCLGFVVLMARQCVCVESFAVTSWLCKTQDLLKYKTHTTHSNTLLSYFGFHLIFKVLRTNVRQDIRRMLNIQLKALNVSNVSP